MGKSVSDSINWVFNYVNLNRNMSGLLRAQAGSDRTISENWQYFAVFLGIFLEPWLREFSDKGTIDLSAITFGSFLARFIPAIFVALILFPGIYRSTFDPTHNRLLQFGTIFGASVGYRSILASLF